MRQKIFVLFLLPLMLVATQAKAQGGMGVKPRDDIWMFKASVRDSLSDEVFARILDLKRYADGNMVDSAAAMIAYNGCVTPEGKWARTLNIAVPEERTRATQILDKVSKLFAELPETDRKYYACFKTTETPSGQRHLYQISHHSGKKSRMVSWIFYPIGEKLALGDFN